MKNHLSIMYAKIMAMFRKKPSLKATPFSEFIRNASAREKKRVYSEVLKKATERQLEVIRKARAAR